MGLIGNAIAAVASETLQRLLQIREIRLVKIYVHAAGSLTEVVFEIFVHGELTGRVTTSPEELGLPMTYQEALQATGAVDERSTDGSLDDAFRIPDYILTALEYVLVHATTERTPVWLSFDLPSGYLPVIPWEARLQPTLQAPVLRLPPLALKPLMPRESLDIVLCLARAVQPQAIADAAQRLQRAVVSSLGRHCRLWIFGEASTQPALNRVKQLYEAPPLQITIPDPREAADYQTARQQGSTRLQNPWLVWICHALGDKSADLAYFVPDATLSEPQSCLVFPPSVLKGVDPGWCQFVPVEEFSAFVTEIGATSVGFTAPLDAHGLAATRMFQEHLAHLRPGPITLQNGQADVDLSGLTQAFRFLYASTDGPPPTSPVMTLFCHPSGTERSLVASALRAVVPAGLRTHVAWATASPAAQHVLGYLLALTPAVKRGVDIVANSDEINRVLEQFTIAAKASAQLTSRENTPAWLAKTQRTLEVAVSRFYVTGAHGEVRQGWEDALKTVASIAEGYASEKSKKKGT